MPPMKRTNPKVDACLRDTPQWREETAKLRRIVLSRPLEEELKWSKPCYSFRGANVAIIIGFKESCALMFCKGALLKDPHRILRQPGENSQSSRWIKFTSVREIAAQETVLKAYLDEAIAAEKAGLKVRYKPTAEYKVPEELKVQLAAYPALQRAFAALTPGRQRGYLLHFGAPKKSETRKSRVDKCAPRILRGEGLND
jgi:uncharacterized protein YdeI (YjbR/CyaY-like superfamily)